MVFGSLFIDSSFLGFFGYPPPARCTDEEADQTDKPEVFMCCSFTVHLFQRTCPSGNAITGQCDKQTLQKWKQKISSLKTATNGTLGGSLDRR